MKKLIIALSLVALFAVVAVAQQKTSLTQRDVRDPRRLAVILEDNAQDVENVINAFLSYLGDGLLVQGDLDASTNDTGVKTDSTAYYRIGGVQYSENANDDNAFSHADTINADEATNTFWGGWAVQINAAGAISTLAETGQSGVVDQSFATSNEAIASASAIVPADGNIKLGYAIIGFNANTNGAEGVTWVANSSNLTDNVTAVFIDADVLELPSR